jgi:hypothetical protein
MLNSATFVTGLRELKERGRFMQLDKLCEVNELLIISPISEVRWNSTTPSFEKLELNLLVAFHALKVRQAVQALQTGLGMRGSAMSAPSAPAQRSPLLWRGLRPASATAADGAAREDAPRLATSA